MVSISSGSQIRNRTSEFLKNQSIKLDHQDCQNLFNQLLNHLNYEYSIIPEKERIGKGHVYIAKYVAKEFFSFLSEKLDYNEDKYLKIAFNLFEYEMNEGNMILKYFSLLFLAEFILKYPQSFKKAENMIEVAADDEEWTVRECAIFPIISGIKKNPEYVLEYLTNLTNKMNQNLRRLVSESLRQSNRVKWLRDPSKNDKVLNILSKLKTDESIYVRKSVGNNLKDLSKYMPQKIITLMEAWIKKFKIKVQDDLASEKGLNEEQKNLIWTIKHALRWIQKKNPEYHDRLGNILGYNYVLYFDEKSNKYAEPR